MWRRGGTAAPRVNLTSDQYESRAGRRRATLQGWTSTWPGTGQGLGFADDKVIFKETPSAQRETAIQGGQVALIFATYSITDARKEKVSFAGPYFIAGQDLLVAANNTDITGPDAMNGKTLCSVTGSTPAEKIKKEYATTVKLFEQDTYSKCVEALVGGTVDAVTTDNVIRPVRRPIAVRRQLRSSEAVLH